jgi:uncharacterized protein
MRVEEIWRYPVKSLGGERLTSADVDRFGIIGDRLWGIADLSTGLVLTARREPELLMANAQLVDGRPIISLADGTELNDDEALSTWLARPVELRSAVNAIGTFENPMDVENESDWMQWDSADGTFHDGGSKISLVSHDSLGVHDHRRFRINLILGGGGEDDLVGAVQVGTAELTISRPIERCIMVTRAQPGLPRDLDVLKQVIRERNNLMGIGAVISVDGTISTGDFVTTM